MTKTVDEVLAEFEKKHNLKVGRPIPVTGLSTGNLAIDWQTGVGGLPAGRITELYGLESSGKTTTALQTAAHLQAEIKANDSDERIVYLDFEHALDSDYAAGLGIDFDHPSFVPLQPGYFEQGANAALSLIETGKVRMVIFDSVAAMAPRRLKEGDFDQATIQMHRAKLMSSLCQTMVGMLHEHNTACVFINHKMESVEMTGRPGLPPKVTTPGGRGLKFYASLRLEFNIVGGIKNKMDDFLSGEEVNQLVGNRVYVNCVKNKVGKPGRTVELRSRYGIGFDNAWSALQILMSRRLAAKAGAWYNFNPKKVPTLTGVTAMLPGETVLQLHGEQAVLDYADTNPQWRANLIELAATQLADVDTDLLTEQA